MTVVGQRLYLNNICKKDENHTCDEMLILPRRQ